MSARVVQVVLDLPVSNHFDYLALYPLPPRGVRVRVPFGRGVKCGLVVGSAAAASVSRERLRTLIERLDDEALFDEDHLGFLQWAADYYHHPLGEVLMGSLPVRLRRGERALPAGEPGWRLTQPGRDSDLKLLARAPRQTAVVGDLRRRGGVATRQHLKQACGAVGGALRALSQRGWLEPCMVLPGERPEAKVTPGPRLTAEQRTAVDAAVHAVGRYAAFLLDGVTGSGKTEVYIRIVEAVLARGQSALVLVPEISLTPQLVGRFRARLGSGVVLQHSGLNERERESAWQAARSGRARVLIGTRSAIQAAGRFSVFSARFGAGTSATGQLGARMSDCVGFGHALVGKPAQRCQSALPTGTPEDKGGRRRVAAIGVVGYSRSTAGSRGVARAASLP